MKNKNLKVKNKNKEKKAFLLFLIILFIISFLLGFFISKDNVYKIDPIIVENTLNKDVDQLNKKLANNKTTNSNYIKPPEEDDYWAQKIYEDITNKNYSNDINDLKNIFIKIYFYFYYFHFEKAIFLSSEEVIIENNINNFKKANNWKIEFVFEVFNTYNREKIFNSAILSANQIYGWKRVGNSGYKDYQWENNFTLEFPDYSNNTSPLFNIVKIYDDENKSMIIDNFSLSQKGNQKIYEGEKIFRFTNSFYHPNGPHDIEKDFFDFFDYPIENKQKAIIYVPLHDTNTSSIGKDFITFFTSIIHHYNSKYNSELFEEKSFNIEYRDYVFEQNYIDYKYQEMETRIKEEENFRLKFDGIEENEYFYIFPESFIFDYDRSKLILNFPSLFINEFYMPKIRIEIPLIIFNLHNLFKISTSSASYWKHLENGETRYHSEIPETNIILSEDYIRALYVFTKKDEVIKTSKKIFGTNWRYYPIIKEKINDFSLNYDNFWSVVEQYQITQNLDIFRNLRPNPKIEKYKNHFKNITFDQYLSVFANMSFSIFWNIEEDNKLDKHKEEWLWSMRNFDKFEKVTIKINDFYLHNVDQLKTHWKINIFSIKVWSIASLYFNNSFFIWNRDENIPGYEIDLPDNTFNNYDLNFKYTNETKSTIQHQYLYQLKGLDISEQVSFVMEDGTVLDQNYKVLKASDSSNLNVGDNGFKEFRYWTTFADGQKEYVILKKQNERFYSPKYEDYIENLDQNFDPKKIEYLFDQNLQMIINPYQNMPGQPITPETNQKFGIKNVADNFNGQKQILENWNDGKWSHAHNQDGIALFDGVFGADINGFFDSVGLLSEGKHHIQIELQNWDFDGLKNDFYISIDKSPTKTNIISHDAVVTGLNIYDQDNNIYPLYYANEPIRFKVQDEDLKSVEAFLIDQSGNWYEIPINIWNKKIDNQWVQVIDSTINYAGFAKIKIVDQAQNEQIIYFWLEQNKNDIQPSFDFDTSLLLDDQLRTFNNLELKIFKSVPELRISSPLVTDVDVQKSSYIDHQWVNQINDAQINEYLPENSDDYDFGKTIDSSQSVLNYAGDELKPFLVPDNQVSWDVTNKLIDFQTPGLYKVSMKLRFLENMRVDRYIFVKNDNSELPIDFSLKKDEFTNFENLPEEDEGEKEVEDKLAMMLEDLSVVIPNFTIASYKVEFSLLWYSNFLPIPNPDLLIVREGKYKIIIEDIFGQTYQYQILVLQKDLSIEARKNQNLLQIYLDKENIDQTAFWKGEIVWNYWRYEDADHAKWEHDDFVNKAIENGLTPEEAEWLYEEMKKNPDWDGNLINPDGTEFDFKEEMETHFPDYLWPDYPDSGGFNPNRPNPDDPWANNNSGSKKLSSASIAGIATGATFGAAMIGGLIAWLFLKRIKGRKIK